MTFLDNIEQLVAVYPLLAFGAVFLAGVFSSASPCVLATIPLVVGFSLWAKRVSGLVVALVGGWFIWHA